MANNYNCVPDYDYDQLSTMRNSGMTIKEARDLLWARNNCVRCWHGCQDRDCADCKYDWDVDLLDDAIDVAVEALDKLL